MPRRFTTEQLEAMASEGRVTPEMRRLLLDEFGAICHHSLCLLACIFPLSGETKESRCDVPLLTVKEVSRLSGISEKTVYRHARSGKLKATRFGRRVMFHPEEVDKYRKIQD